MDGHAQVAQLCEQIRVELETRHIQSRAIENATYSIECLSKAYADPIAGGFDWSRFGLTRTQMRYCELLHAKLGRTVTRDALINGHSFDFAGESVCNKTVDVHIFNIRKKLARSPFFIDREYGVGYRMVRRPIPEAAQAALKAA